MHKTKVKDERSEQRLSLTFFMHAHPSNRVLVYDDSH